MRRFSSATQFSLYCHALTHRAARQIFTTEKVISLNPRFPVLDCDTLNQRGLDLNIDTLYSRLMIIENALSAVYFRYLKF